MFLTQEHKGCSYALISGLLYGLIGYLGVSIMRENFSAYNMLFWRFFISSVAILPLIFFQKNQPITNLRANLKMLIFGGLFYSVSTILFFIGSKYIGTGLSMVIFFTYPAAVLLLNWVLFGVKPSKIYYLATIIIIIGLILLIDLSALTFDLIGIAIGLFSALAYGSYVVLSKHTATSPLMSSLMVSLGCSFMCFILAFLDNSFTVPQTIPLWINLLSFGIFCTALPILLLLEALKNISSEKASILSVLEPVFVVIFGVLFLNEHLQAQQIFGIITVLGGALITLLSNNRIFLNFLDYKNKNYR